MSWTALLLMAVGVGMDAMTAAVAVGLTVRVRRVATAVRMALWFALAHAVMPLVGWLTVGLVADALETVSGWLIVITLMGLGAYRLWQAFHPETEGTGHSHLLLTAMSTGLDAMSVGVTMALSPPTGVLGLPAGALLGCVLTAAVTFVMCLIGVLLGSRLGRRFGRPAMLIGGGLLIFLSLRALLAVVL